MYNVGIHVFEVRFDGASPSVRTFKRDGGGGGGGVQNR